MLDFSMISLVSKWLDKTVVICKIPVDVLMLVTLFLCWGKYENQLNISWIFALSPIIITIFYIVIKFAIVLIYMSCFYTPRWRDIKF